jgi:hypothetical protein
MGRYTLLAILAAGLDMGAAQVFKIYPQEAVAVSDGAPTIVEVSLISQPSSDVLVDLGYIPFEISNHVAISPMVFTFNASGWDKPQQIKLTVNNPITAASTQEVKFRGTSSDVNFAQTAFALKVTLPVSSTSSPTKEPTLIPTVHPTYTPTFTPSTEPSYAPTVKPSSGLTSEPTLIPTYGDIVGYNLSETNILMGEQTTWFYTVSLQQPPMKDVSLHFMSVEPAELSALISSTPRTLLFTKDNWNQPQQVVLYAYGKDLFQDQTAILSYQASSVDPRYNQDNAFQIGVTVVAARVITPDHLISYQTPMMFIGGVLPGPFNGAAEDPNEVYFADIKQVLLIDSGTVNRLGDC